LLEDLARQKKHNDKYEIMVDAAIQTDRLRLSFKKLQIRSRRSDAETMITKDLGQIMVILFWQFFLLNSEHYNSL